MDAEQREEFMAELYAGGGGAESTAKEQLREHMQKLGVEWDGEV